MGIHHIVQGLFHECLSLRGRLQPGGRWPDHGPFATEKRKQPGAIIAAGGRGMVRWSSAGLQDAASVVVWVDAY